MYNQRFSRSHAWKWDRILLLKTCVVILGVLVFGKLFFLQVIHHQEYNERALKKYNRTLTIPASRGEILLYDNKQEAYYTLATNTTFDLLYVDPVAFEERFIRNRDLVLKAKMSYETFPYASLEEYYDDVSNKLGQILNKNPKEVKEILMEKYNNHIVLDYEPPADVVFRFQQNPVEGVFLVSEYDQLIRDIAYEDDDYKIKTLNAITASEKEEMQNNFVEIYVDPTMLTEIIPESLDGEAKKHLVKRNDEKIISTAKKIYENVQDYSLEDLQRILTRKLLRYNPIQKKISLEQSKAIAELNYYGLVLQPESYRLYPEKSLAANLLGFVDKEAMGRYSIEGQYDLYLRGQDGYKVIDIDNLGNQITVGEEDVVDPINGEDLVLTIDRSIQQYVEKVLQETVEKFYAKGGQVIVMEPKTGAIIAMASYPTYDPNEFYKVYEKDEKTEKYINGVGPQAFFNPAVAGTYEPGSTYKIFTVATALDSGDMGIDERVCDETGRVEIQVDNQTYVIQNSNEKAHGCMTMEELLEKSSNIGALRISLKVGARVFRKYMQDFGFSEFTDIGLEDENPGHVRDIKEWGKVLLANAGFGQGFTASPIQLVAATGAIANGGKLMRPYVISEKHTEGKVLKTEPFSVRRVVKPVTAEQVKQMLIKAVDNGLAGNAAIPGYSVAGKTGTSQVAAENGQGYSTENYITSFVGFAPAKDPAFVMLVKIDHPRQQKFGALVAAPAFSQIGEYILKYLEIPRDR